MCVLTGGERPRKRECRASGPRISNKKRLRVGRAGVDILRGLAIFFVLMNHLLGELLARFYSEPTNRIIRRRFVDGPARLGSVMSSDAAA
jgi:hypothetical protein